MIRRPPRSTLSSSSAASDVYKRQIRKSSTILNRPDSSNDTDSARRNSLISSGALSLPKDISYLLNEQQLMDEIIEKAKQGSPVGREKMLES